MAGGERISRERAKAALDNLIRISRIHFYKPIQIAEILYHKRCVNPSLNLSDKEEYRTVSKKWRDDVSIELLGRKCTSSARFQDDLFNENAIPPQILEVLGEENNRTGGAVEAYIYRCFIRKHGQLSEALDYCLKSTKNDFDVKKLIDSFREEAGLKRSLDKLYEIIVYALFSTIIDVLDVTVQVSIDEQKMDIVKEFEDFTKSVICIDLSKPVNVQKAKVYRVGVTNAADRGLDMYANWGPAIQIKHLSLDEELAEDITESISSDKIIIVCKSAEKKVILSLLTQIGWKSRIQSIVTEDDLVEWYEKALRGKYSEQMGNKLIGTLIEEISEEFPSLDTQSKILSSRHYEKIQDHFWK